MNNVRGRMQSCTNFSLFPSVMTAVAGENQYFALYLRHARNRSFYRKIEASDLSSAIFYAVINHYFISLPTNTQQ